MNAALDARYAAALAAVAASEARCADACARARATVALYRLPRCSECHERFVPGDPRQRCCGARACLRSQRARWQRRWREHVRAVRLDLSGLGRDIVCGCGGTLRPEMQPGGAVLDRCTACGALTPVRRKAG